MTNCTRCNRTIIYEGSFCQLCRDNPDFITVKVEGRSTNDNRTSTDDTTNNNSPRSLVD